MSHEGMAGKSQVLLVVDHCDLMYFTKVKREVRMNDRAELYIEPTLARYEDPDIPEQLLVLRT